MKLEDCEDVKFLQKQIEELWGILDDIDTISDMVKSDDKAYRELVERKQRERWDSGIESDGYILFALL